MVSFCNLTQVVVAGLSSVLQMEMAYIRPSMGEFTFHFEATVVTYSSIFSYCGSDSVFVVALSFLLAVGVCWKSHGSHSVGFGGSSMKYL
jgi:hypothetical protein